MDQRMAELLVPHEVDAHRRAAHQRRLVATLERSPRHRGTLTRRLGVTLIALGQWIEGRSTSPAAAQATSAAEPLPEPATAG